MTGRLCGIEALRGVAAMLVVAAHATAILGSASPDGSLPFLGFWHFGRAGVDFFFVLSGFIITYIHYGDIGRRGRLASFWAKRLWRIYPTWWIVAGMYAALLWISPTRDRAEQDLHHALFSFFLLPERSMPVLGPGWSLRHELLFYALFSTALISRRAGIAVLGAWFIGVVTNLAVQLASGEPLFDGLEGELLFRGFNIEFFFGIATAFLVLRRECRWPTAIALLGGAGFLASGLFESFGPAQGHEWPIRHLAYGASAAAVLYGAAALDRSGRHYVPRLAVRLGAASYSIYLLHVPVLLIGWFAYRKLHAPMPAELAFCTLMALAACAGVAFSERVEQPLLRFGRSIVDPRRWLPLSVPARLT